MNIALIIGCARSGTSILGEVIASHPDVRYIFEAHEIWESAGSGVNGSHRLVAGNAGPEIKSFIRGWFERQQGAARLLLEKTPRNVLRVPFVREIFPEAKIIHIVRDGRDVACSMVPGCGGEGWFHLKPPSWKELFQSHTGAMRCALAWKEIMEIALRDLEGVDHIQIRYEDLIGDPEGMAAAILRYLDLTQEAPVKNFCKKIQDSTAGSYHAQIQVMWFRNDHASRVGRWRENLTLKEKDEINEILWPTLVKLGYE